MSFAKLHRFSRGSGRRPTQSRKVNTPKQDWVSTIHDLNVHKATPEELKRRHELHESQNRVAAQLELKERILRQKLRKSRSISPAHVDPTRVINTEDVLARTDRALAVVKDLFGDAPYRQTDLPVLLNPEPATSLSLLSQSIMDPQALNEFKDVGRERNEEEPDPSSSTTHSCSVGMSRSGQLLQEEARGPSSRPSSAPDQLAERNVLSRQSQSGGQPQSTLVGQVLRAALATSAPARKSGSSNSSRKCCGEPLGHDGVAGKRSSLSLLQCMLGEVEAELDFLELEEPLGSASAEHSPPSLTGFSVSLLRTVSRLARFLRQSREELQREVQERKRLAEEVLEQRSLIDALTAETLSLREESHTLKDQLQLYVWDADQRLRASSTVPYCVESAAGERNAQEQTLSSPAQRDQLPPPAQRDQLPPPAQRDQLSLGPAVLLSPPRQRNGPHPHSHSAAEQGMTVQRPAVHSPEHHYTEQQQEVLAKSAILEQIAELTQQNGLIRAQLEQLCTEPAGPMGSQDPGSHTTPDSVAQEKAPPAVSCMEQRLLELNRQSTEARCRLLELIELQSQASVSAASPSVSPIPPNTRALTASADGDRRTPDVPISVPKASFPLLPAAVDAGGPVEGWFYMSTQVQ